MGLGAGKGEETIETLQAERQRGREA